MVELIRERRGGWIQTFTGKKFYSLDPRVEDICIEDIAHSLSMMCRYGGHCLEFYSVAEHCVLLSQVADGPDKLWALLHDAPEGYLVDVPSPYKAELGGFRAWESRLMRCIAERFGLTMTIPYSVDLLDKRIVQDEKQQNTSDGPGRWVTDALVPLGVTLKLWTPKEAEAAFLRTFHELRHVRGLGAFAA